MNIRYFFAILFASILLVACGEDSKKTPQETTKVKIPAFSAQGAYDLVKAQVDLGYRCPECPGAQKAIDFMKNELKQAGWAVETQSFDAKLYTGKEVKGVNVIGRYNPHVKERVMLCAHWDSRMIADKDTTRVDQPIDGANDGASGVGVLLQLAKTIQANPIPMGVDIIFFDMEDQGDDGGNDPYSWGLGSQYWAKNLHEKPYQIKYGILLDMVGHKDAVFPMEGYSLYSAPDVVRKVWGVAKILGKQKYFVNKQIGGITDDHRFIIESAKLPMIDIIDYREEGFMKEHHTHGDGMNAIDKNTLGAVGQVVTATIYKESNKEL